MQQDCLRQDHCLRQEQFVDAYFCMLVDRECCQASAGVKKAVWYERREKRHRGVPMCDAGPISKGDGKIWRYDTAKKKWKKEGWHLKSLG